MVAAQDISRDLDSRWQGESVMRTWLTRGERQLLAVGEMKRAGSEESRLRLESIFVVMVTYTLSTRGDGIAT